MHVRHAAAEANPVAARPSCCARSAGGPFKLCTPCRPVRRFALVHPKRNETKPSLPPAYPKRTVSSPCVPTPAGQAGFVANMSDIAPRHAGLLFGLCNTFGSFAGILGVSGGWLQLEAPSALGAEGAQQRRAGCRLARRVPGSFPTDCHPTRRPPARPAAVPPPRRFLQCAGSCWRRRAASPPSSRPPQRCMLWARWCGTR